jgi:quercetin 2,3-dioxygenase
MRRILQIDDTVERSHEYHASLDRVETVGPRQDLAPGTYNRAVITPANFADQSPFILMMEDFIGPAMDFYMHPHRGLETVTLLLDGQLQHRDHTGDHGVLKAGDIQWMTAGRGIEHGGKPVGEGRAHALQLWLNLPAALKMSAPGTRVQSRDEAIFETRAGATIRTYGGPRAVPLAPWSRWPITVTDVELTAGAEHQVDVPTESRLFAYVLNGELTIGADRRRLRAGQIGWLNPVDDRSDETRKLELRATTSARLVVYMGTPIYEQIVAGGPFVMNSQEQIDKAYADLRAGTFLDPVQF